MENLLQLVSFQRRQRVCFSAEKTVDAVTKKLATRFVGRKSSREIRVESRNLCRLQSAIFWLLGDCLVGAKALLEKARVMSAHTLRQNHTAAFLLIKMNIHCGGAQLFHLSTMKYSPPPLLASFLNNSSLSVLMKTLSES
jgi:hypothetical protein